MLAWRVCGRGITILISVIVVIQDVSWRDFHADPSY